MENLYWREPEESKQAFKVPGEIYDLSFTLRGSRLDIDHAFALAAALRTQLGADVCERIGVHGVHLAGSGNGWKRPEHGDADIPLSRRARLVIRIHRDDHDALVALSGQTLELGSQRLQVGKCSTRPLSALGSLHTRALSCDEQQSEPEFLVQVAGELEGLGIDVARMICGRSGEIRLAGSRLFTRALLVADLKPEESVRLQQHGLGDSRLLGCGLFVPHRGIDAVYTAQG